MTDTRKNVKVTPLVKAGIDRIKKENQLKTDSKSIAYLLAFYKLMQRDLTHEEHKQIMKYIDDSHNQASF